MLPISGASLWTPEGGILTNGAVDLSRDITTDSPPFFDALNARRSAVGSGMTPVGLSSVLWHSTLLRSRGPGGRFGLPWESRSAPSAGGLHPIRILSLPVQSDAPAGIYDHYRHRVLLLTGIQTALAANASSVFELTGSQCGVTLQFAADRSKLDACYENAASLLWRDAGALVSTICLVASALGLAAVPLGRTGTTILRAAGIGTPFIGVGGVHLGGPANRDERE